jgi:N-acetylmuramoyl-L-alanine amidase
MISSTSAQVILERRRLLRWMALAASGGFWLPVLASAQAAAWAQVGDIRFWPAPDHTRVVFESDQPLEHRMFRLVNPPRVVLDLSNARLAVPVSRLKVDDPILKGLRSGMPKPNVLRLVMDVHKLVEPRVFSVPARAGRGDRLVVDLRLPATAAAPTPVPVRSRREADVGGRTGGMAHGVVVIDPGHGGEDPGAIGPFGTHEKDVVLSVARKTVEQLNRTPGLRAFLTRTGDYYVPLRQRVRIAREYDADLFISLHADAFRTRDARGASAYCLSEGGKPSPDRLIKALEENENSTDLIGGVDLGAVEDPNVAGLLMDLSQRDAIQRGLMLGERLLTALERVPDLILHFDKVKHAGFAVLKAPDIASVLVELAFLSNPQEERLLRKTTHQEALAEALALGANQYMGVLRKERGEDP